MLVAQSYVQYFFFFHGNQDWLAVIGGGLVTKLTGLISTPASQFLFCCYGAAM